MQPKDTYVELAALFKMKKEVVDFEKEIDAELKDEVKEESKEVIKEEVEFKDEAKEELESELDPEDKEAEIEQARVRNYNKFGKK